MNATQARGAQLMLGVGTQLGASTLALVACIFDSIYESGIWTNNGWNSGGYGGPLGGNVSVFGQYGGPSSEAVLRQEAHYFFLGGNGFQGGGAMHLSTQSTDVAFIGSQVTAAVPFNGQGYSTQYLSQHFPFSTAIAEARAIVAAFGAGVLPGGTAGLGGTGLPANDISKFAFTVGDTSNPHEDFWTAANRLSQDRQWYLFSDGETMYLADGPDLMAQEPAMSLDRINDAASIISLQFTWDNTAFQYSSTHKKRRKIQRRTTLAKVISPVSANLQVICKIDEVRAGDTIFMTGCGPGDGAWLVGDCRRSIFNTYSEITLVPALAPLTEQQAAGTAGGKNAISASKVNATGTVLSAMISAAATINNQNLPYKWGGGHAQIGTPSNGIPGGSAGSAGPPPGYDCSGSVAAVLKAGGLMAVNSIGNDTAVIAQLQSEGVLANGQGSGSAECTLFDNPGIHIYMRLNGKYWGSAAGGALPDNGAGIGWISRGGPEAGFRVYHIPPSILALQASGALGQTQSAKANTKNSKTGAGG